MLALDTTDIGDINIFPAHRHRRELKEWDELLERQRLEVEQSRQNCESNKNINYSYLRSEDIAALKTYLTSDQLNVLDQPSPVDQAFIQQASSQLKDIVSCDVLSLSFFVICVLWAYFRIVVNKLILMFFSPVAF